MVKILIVGDVILAHCTFGLLSKRIYQLQQHGLITLFLNEINYYI